MVFQQNSVAVSLCTCVLGLSLSLVSAQFPAARLAPRGFTAIASVDFTGRIVSFDEFTSGAQAYQCFITPTGNNWFDPTGTALFPGRVGNNPGANEILLDGIGGDVSVQGLLLHRGPNYYKLDGEWCCGSNNRAQSDQDRCLTFTPCPTLPVLTNGVITYNSNNNMATYTCNAGHIVVGTSSNTITRTCSGTTTSAGSWSGSDPFCVFVQCPTLDNPINGMVSISPADRGFGAVATYSCNPGYMLSSIDPVTCMSNSEWSPQPTCLPVDCGPLSDPANGVVDTRDGTTFMMTATYACDSGFFVRGTTSRTITGTCQSNRIWSVSVPFCDVLCPREAFSANGVVTYSTNDSIIVPGQTAMYSCDTGYNLDPPSSMRTCMEGTGWSFNLPTCNILCPRETLSANGVVTYSTNDAIIVPGQTAMYSCDTGFNLDPPSSMRTCIEGTGWSFNLPTCNIIDCGPLDNPDNGLAVQSGGTTFNQVTTYSCNTGYLIDGASSRTCMDNGQWNPGVPNCDFITFTSNALQITNPQANITILISDIGEGQAALTCFSDVSSCCTTEGQWSGPNGIIPNSEDGDGLNVIRSLGPPGSISLNQRGITSTAGGLYCCDVPRLSGVNSSTCVRVIPSCMTDAQPFEVILGVLLGAAVAFNVVLIIIIVLIKKTNTKATGRGAVSYEIPDTEVEYEEVVDIVASTAAVKMTECPAYQQTEAVTMTECPAYELTREHIYDNADEMQ